ncbi:FxSxx-COOH system tetratricopeptide repeat protein [Actinomadura geliboluensis]|uniref:Tetratricopeptide repeat protein n=1 Tax=Actinomadura geliboluensis TaxID=882440 RepID=A0A5S4H718_9ACTN|nr:FxSxx-COOH system tetratricopeptide repeat protein [Actinomadura geliboluensis]TMR40531.1 tetratricopeptide repeat protein [Actinomadura geliboluensis]
MLEDVSRSGRGHRVVSPVAVAAVPVGIGLVGNLATGTVEMKAWWWAPATWVVTGLLVAVTVIVQIRQSRAEADRDESESGRGAAQITNLPARNPYFTGRTALLDQIHHRLRSSDRNGDTVVPLGGMGGVGKTQLALEYAHRHADEYTVVWWVNAETAALATTDLLALAERLGIRATAAPAAVLAELWTVLAEHEDRLLIFDNVEDTALWGGLRPRSGGRLLITGRITALRRLAPVIEVCEMPRAESRGLLRSRAPALAPDDLERVLDALGDLPLALEQAGCFLAETGLDVDGFLDLLASHPAGAGLDDPTLDRHPGLAGMVAAGRARLRALDASTGELLDQISFLAPEQLPVAAGSDQRGVRLGNTATTLRKLALLTALGLARNDGQRLLAHRLVQALLRSALSEAERVTALAGAQRLLATAPLGETRDMAAWPARALFTPHIQALSTHLTSMDTSSFIEDEQFRRLVIDHLDYLNTSGQHDPVALALAGQTRRRWTAALGRDHPDVLDAAHALTTALYWTDQLEAAFTCGQDTLERRRRVLGEDHPSTIRTANNLAFCLMRLGRHGQARDLCLAMAGHRRTLGDDHPAVLGTAFALAAANNRLGDYAEARDLDLDVLERRRRLYGEDHPDTLRSARNLAHDLFHLGAFEQALRLQRDTLRRQRRVLGDDHPDARQSANDLDITRRSLAGEG